MPGMLTSMDCLYSKGILLASQVTFSAHGVVICVWWWVMGRLYDDAGKYANSSINSVDYAMSQSYRFSICMSKSEEMA